ncbi:F0F1 ATP synthase subunit epsilon [Dactylosporangium roseum]|uniref:ATP synthase epsilon chain n=1 Tax=Dactylosporangium roseum TaxID=47989 RepID=A0ABY5Z7J3_9ACTN|nr:F0F1 ATP synthase subunit epsilon [Dactylosporangium roseum]UWZ38035.1 F0F1 ATP synthase subunit epsilon [Dactylosporangium roseum]
MARQLHVELVAVEEKVWSGDADMIVARTTEGELGVLPGHAPLLGQLAEPGQVRIKQSGQEFAFDVSGGFLSVTATGVTVLAESCAPASSAAAH